MNTNRYPSIELCRKLTEIGFPPTEYNSIMLFTDTLKMKGNATIEVDENKNAVFNHIPNVMEMLDVMPEFIPDGTHFSKWHIQIGKCGGFWAVQYGEGIEESQTLVYFEEKENLPNTLAEMILWLHKNNYISFSK